MPIKPTECLDLRTIPQQDLKMLAEICASRQDQPFFRGQLRHPVTRILLAQHECSEMSEYPASKELFRSRRRTSSICSIAINPWPRTTPDKDVPAIQFDRGT